MELGRQHKIIIRKVFSISLIILFLCLFCSLVGIAVATNIINNRFASSSETNQQINEDFSQINPDELLNNTTPTIAESYAHSNGIIYLTFDDGPGPHTARLLDILKAHNIKATFFVTGSGDDNLIAREYQEGHTVGLHTWSHRYDIIYSSLDSYFNDLNLIADRVKRITGEDAKLIRFPGGSSNLVSASYDKGIRIMSALASEVTARGYQYFDWNIASGDAGNTTSSDVVYANVINHLKPGVNVVLQHDIKGFSVDAVERIIDYGLANNYTFSKLDISSPAVHHGINN